MTKVSDHDILKYYKKGYSDYKIATLLRVSQPCICTRRHSLGLVSHNPSKRDYNTSEQVFRADTRRREVNKEWLNNPENKDRKDKLNRKWLNNPENKDRKSALYDKWVKGNKLERCKINDKYNKSRKGMIMREQYRQNNKEKLIQQNKDYFKIEKNRERRREREKLIREKKKK